MHKQHAPNTRTTTCTSTAAPTHAPLHAQAPSCPTHAPPHAQAPPPPPHTPPHAQAAPCPKPGPQPHSHCPTHHAPPPPRQVPHARTNHHEAGQQPAVQDLPLRQSHPSCPPHPSPTHARANHHEAGQQPAVQDVPLRQEALDDDEGLPQGRLLQGAAGQVHRVTLQGRQLGAVRSTELPSRGGSFFWGGGGNRCYKLSGVSGLILLSLFSREVKGNEGKDDNIRVFYVLSCRMSICLSLSYLITLHYALYWPHEIGMFFQSLAPCPHSLTCVLVLTDLLFGDSGLL